MEGRGEQLQGMAVWAHSLGMLEQGTAAQNHPS